jgi:hypothetical protein
VKKYSFICLAIVFLLNIAGCVSVPPVHVSEGIKSEELASHVQFLSQPALKGRKPKTFESGIARKYIEKRFAAYGLVPWGQAKDFEQPFGYGTNVVGVLPGSDPNLAREFVLVSAHYDHVGRNKKGKICPGAADNASGVAALLETAKQMSLFEKRPKRSVAFAAFDCEELMLFGSFAFSCQKDVNDAKIAAVVNVDVLGRDFLDVVRHTLFVSGTEGYPEIREKMCEFGRQDGIRVLTIGTDLIGPRGDHVAFESRPIPSLFFSSGAAYKDYHAPGDTADKLNYADIEKSAQLILETVEGLANGHEAERVEAADDGFIEELRTLSTIVADVNARFDRTGMKKEDIEKFTKLAAETENFLNNDRYDRKAREKLAADATGLLAPYLVPAEILETVRKDKKEEEFTAGLQCIQQFYVHHRQEAIHVYKMLVAHVLKYRPGLFRGMPKFEYEIYEISDENISMVPSEPNRFKLNALADSIKVQAGSSGWLIKSFHGGVSGGCELIDCEGTKEQITDYCLLKLRGESKNDLHIKGIKKVLLAVTGTEPDGNYEEMVQKQLNESGFKDETEWVRSCILGDSPELTMEAIKASKKNNRIISEALCEVIAGQNIRPDVRATAIECAGGKNKDELLAMCDVLDDNSPSYKKEYLHVFGKDYPVSENIIIKAMRPKVEKYWEENHDASKTVGDLAYERLKCLTKKDFGKDNRCWRKWIEKNMK